MKQVLLFGLFSLFLFGSCSKEVDKQIQASLDLNVPLYFVDNVLVSEEDFPDEENRAYLGITQRKDTEEELPVFNAFTSKVKYIDWGRANGYKVEMELELEEHLYQYAEENGIINRYEESGVVAPSYLAYQQEFITKMHIKYGLMENNRAPAFLRKTCFVVSDFFIMSAAATLPSSHNNTVSATLHTHPQAFHSIYDRTFFRRKIGTFWEFGAQYTCFLGWFAQFDNRMSSVMII